jgi:uncharacterized protein
MPVSIIEIRVKLRASRSELVQLDDGRWFAYLKSPPVDGRANNELITLVANKFACSKSEVEIIKGATSRSKVIRYGRE